MDSAIHFSSTSTAATSAASFPAVDGDGDGGSNPYALRGNSYAAGVRSWTSTWARLFGGGVAGDEDEDFVCRGGGGGGVRGGGAHFLDACFLCRKPLGGNRDIFMYRGDTPFCSEECRREQIEMDEEKERKEKKKKAVPMKADSWRREVEAPPKSQKVRAGSILAG